MRNKPWEDSALCTSDLGSRSQGLLAARNSHRGAPEPGSANLPLDIQERNASQSRQPVWVPGHPPSLGGDGGPGLHFSVRFLPVRTLCCDTGAWCSSPGAAAVEREHSRRFTENHRVDSLLALEARRAGVGRAAHSSTLQLPAAPLSLAWRCVTSTSARLHVASAPSHLSVCLSFPPSASLFYRCMEGGWDPQGVVQDTLFISVSLT